MIVSISSNDLKSGMTIIYNGILHEVLEFQHIKPGKGHAFVRTKLKNLKSNAIFEYSFRAKEDINQAIIEKRNLHYSYRDKNLYYFMDPQNYEQIPVEEEKIEHILEYLKEEENVNFSFHDGEVIQANVPDFMNLKVVEAQPGVKGNTVQGATKPVTLETGKVVQAPLFINQGDVLKIDTRIGKYVERVSIKSN